VQLRLTAQISLPLGPLQPVLSLLQSVDTQGKLDQLLQLQWVSSLLKFAYGLSDFAV
jgi:hypothetical protein